MNKLLKTHYYLITYTIKISYQFYAKLTIFLFKIMTIMSLNFCYIAKTADITLPTVSNRVIYDTF